MTGYRTLVLRLFCGMLLSTALVSCSAVVRPSPTATATEAPTQASSSVPTPLPVNVSVDRQADGTSVVKDVDNAYEFTLAQEWMAIAVSSEQIDRVAKGSPAPDPEFLRLAQSLGQAQTDAFRLVGINTDSQFANAADPTLVLVTAIPDRVSATLPMPELARMIQNTVFTDPNAVSQGVVRNAHGLDIAVVEGPYEYLTTQGDTLKTRSKVLGFQANTKVILIQFITPADSGAEVLAGTDPVIDTIQRTLP